MKKFTLAPVLLLALALITPTASAVLEANSDTGDVRIENENLTNWFSALPDYSRDNYIEVQRTISHTGTDLQYRARLTNPYDSGSPGINYDKYSYVVFNAENLWRIPNVKPSIDEYDYDRIQVDVAALTETLETRSRSSFRVDQRSIECQFNQEGLWCSVGSRPALTFNYRVNDIEVVNSVLTGELPRSIYIPALKISGTLVSSGSFGNYRGDVRFKTSGHVLDLVSDEKDTKAEAIYKYRVATVQHPILLADSKSFTISGSTFPSGLQFSTGDLEVRNSTLGEVTSTVNFHLNRSCVQLPTFNCDVSK